MISSTSVYFRKKFKKACDVIHDHSDKIIRERRKLLAERDMGTDIMDFLHILLTAKVSMLVYLYFIMA